MIFIKIACYVGLKGNLKQIRANIRPGQNLHRAVQILVQHSTSTLS